MASSALLAESHSFRTLFLPKSMLMTSTPCRLIRSNVFLRDIFPWNSRRLLLLMFMSFFSSSLSVLAASSSMFDPLAAVMAYFLVMFRNSSPYCSTNLCPTPTMAEKSSTLVGTR